MTRAIETRRPKAASGHPEGCSSGTRPPVTTDRSRSEPGRIARCKYTFGRQFSRSWWKLALMVLGLLLAALALGSWS